MTNKCPKLIYRLEEVLDSFNSLAIAFSGGVDSSFLALAAKKSGINFILYHVKSPFTPSQENRFAKEWAKSENMSFRIIEPDIMSQKDITDNNPMRCYHCKKFIFKLLLDEAGRDGFKILADGTNRDDLEDYRPGLKAAEELKVVHPLIEAGFDKEKIRLAAKFLGLPNWDEPASACLASRIPYGTIICHELLEKIRKAEDFLLEKGIHGSRIRVLNCGKDAKIEILPKDFDTLINQKNIIINYFTKLGFSEILLDLKGYRKGSLNKGI